MKNIEKSFFYKASPEIFKRARDLRKVLTGDEKLLWDELKENKLGVHFRRQHPIGKFIVDFYCHQLSLVIELDGGIHLKPNVAEKDEGREYELKRMGLTVIRFKNEEILNNMSKVLASIKTFILTDGN